MNDNPDSMNPPADASSPPLERVLQEMNRWFDVAKATGERALETLGMLGPGRTMVPSVDIVELSDEVLVLVDLPGVSAESVQLTLAGNMLTVKGTRSNFSIPQEKNARFHLVERDIVGFERSVPLPVSVNAEGIHAETRDGLLKVTLPKTLAAPHRSIPVTRGGSEPIYMES